MSGDLKTFDWRTCSSRGGTRSDCVAFVKWNLPELELLDLAYNSLPNFDFDFCDQVGTLSALRVNVSHNNIFELSSNQTINGFLGRSEHGSIYHSNIKTLDLSHNMISKIGSGFFRPAEVSLTHLHLAHNQLTNTSRDVFGNMPHLHWLDLSYNLLNEMDYDSFRNSRRLQVLYLSQNQLQELPQEIFKPLFELRVVGLSHNSLRALPDGLFTNQGMESLDLSYNSLAKIPVMSLTNLAALTLCELDLSHNSIAAIHSMDLSNKFRSLSHLNLAFNRLFRLDDAAFATLPRLTSLDLSHNNELKVMDKAFIGLENSLIKLGLTNVSLTTVPELPLPHLRELHLSGNELPSIPQELAQNLSSLTLLDLSLNDLTSVPKITHSLPQLRSLSLASNSITSLTNATFFGFLEKIEHLDVSNLNLYTLETGTLGTTPSLKSLRLSPYPNVFDFNIPKLVHGLDNLRSLWIDAPVAPRIAPTAAPASIIHAPLVSQMPVVASDLRHEMFGILPRKVRSITIAGKGFTAVAETILNGVTSPTLHFALKNTSISMLSESIFHNLRHIQNISIDVSDQNFQLTQLSNPNTAQRPLQSERVYLTDLKVATSSFNCDCGVGWIEYWQRKQRQYVCRAQTWSQDVFNSAYRSTVVSKNFCNLDDGHRLEDELRDVTCSNKNSQLLIEVLKSELECGWNSAPKLLDTRFWDTILMASIAVFFSLWF